MDEAAFQDIANAIHRLRAAFAKHGMAPPKGLELGSYEDGHRFRSYMPRDMVMMQPSCPPENDPEWVANLIGVEIRMPAKWRRDFDGFGGGSGKKVLT